jgi:uncharacterized protein (UPF0548 family)
VSPSCSPDVRHTFRRVRIAAAALIAALALSGVAVSSAEAFTCQNRDFWMRHYGTGLIVSAELDYQGVTYGMLRARSERLLAWERFHMVCLGGGQVAIRSTANNRYVSAELEYTDDYIAHLYGLLRARATVIDAWERFIIRDVAGGGILLQNSANGRYAAAEFDYSDGFFGMLRARTGVPDTFNDWSWERFDIVWL